MHTCVIKELLGSQHIAAAQDAININPANRPRIGPSFGPLTPQRIAAITSKIWGKTVDLSVRFMDTSNTGLKAKILAHMNNWNKFGNIKFRETTSNGDVRITLAGDGYWSYLGTDIRSVPANEPTMSLQDFSLSTPETEYLRVVQHETGHTLGCPHEHARPEIVSLLDPAKTIAEFARLYGWDEQTVREQVLTPLDAATLTALPPDVTSIMAYQFSGNCTKNGQPIPGGLDIDPEDGALMGKLYPLTVQPPPPPVKPPTGSTVVQFGSGSMTLTKDHAALSLNVTGASADTPAAAAFGFHLPNFEAIGIDLVTMFLDYKIGNITGLIAVAKKLLADLGVKDPTPDDHTKPDKFPTAAI